MSDVQDLMKRHGQGHLLMGLDDLDENSRALLLAELQSIDWEELQRPAAAPAAEEIGAARVVTLEERGRRHGELAAAGEIAYRAGQVAVLMVAGGQGTRLGSTAPKGCFPLMPLSGKTIYQVQSEKVLSLSLRLGRQVPFLVMTSPATDKETRDFFAAHDRFGLAEGQLRFFCQGTVPSVDLSGRALRGAPERLLTNPDGHGGCFTALVQSGQLRRLRDEGARHLVYIQVDNVLSPVDDPVLVGLAVVEGTDVITKVLEKADPDEKVGHLVRAGVRDRIVEYTELSPEDVRRRGPDGELIYRWGSPALHCFSVEFLARLADRGFRLPLHRSRKPLQAHVDGAVREVAGWKSERFIFDLIPEAERSLGLQVVRDDEFAPVKNQGGTDSPATAVQLASGLYARWLAAAGVRVSLPEGARLEISPLYAATEAQLRQRQGSRPHEGEITGDTYLDA